MALALLKKDCFVMRYNIYLYTIVSTRVVHTILYIHIICIKYTCALHCSVSPVPSDIKSNLPSG